jgi:hypothetical protein
MIRGGRPMSGTATPQDHELPLEYEPFPSVPMAGAGLHVVTGWSGGAVRDSCWEPVGQNP